MDLEDAAASDVAISFAATATEVLTATADPALRFVPDFLLTICPCNQGRINHMADKAKCLGRTKKKGLQKLKRREKGPMEVKMNTEDP